MSSYIIPSLLSCRSGSWTWCCYHCVFMNLKIDQNCNEKKFLIWKLLIGTTEYKKNPEFYVDFQKSTESLRNLVLFFWRKASNFKDVSMDGGAEVTPKNTKQSNTNVEQQVRNWRNDSNVSPYFNYIFKTETNKVGEFDAKILFFLILRRRRCRATTRKTLPTLTMSRYSFVSR